MIAYVSDLCTVGAGEDVILGAAPRTCAEAARARGQLWGTSNKCRAKSLKLN